MAARQHGVVTRRQLEAAGLSPRQTRSRLAGGVLVRVFPGVYRVGGVPESYEQRVMAAVLATGGVASHRSAAALWELRGSERDQVEVTVHARRPPDLAGVVSHRTRQLDPVDVTLRRSIPVTTPGRTLLDLGAVAPEHVVESALEDALHRRLVSRVWLERVLDRTGRHGRDGTAVLRRLVAERSVDQEPTESPIEDEFVRLIRRRGLPEPVRQYWLAPPGVRPVRVDFAYPEARVAIEIQGFVWHAGRADLQRDCEKHNLLVRLGWRLLVFTSDDVRRRPQSVVEAVRMVERCA